MKNSLYLILTLACCFTISNAFAQPGMRRGGMGGGMPGAPAGPNIGAKMSKLFGENTSFSANMEIQSKQSGSATPLVMPGKIAFDQGSSRVETDLTKMSGGPITPEMATQMKEMGMSEMTRISVPGKKVTLTVYPGLKSYVEIPMSEAEATAKPADYKIETAELAKETIDGHPCVKNKVTVIDGNGVKTESTVWNATDLKNFPIQIETTEDGTSVTMLFKDTKLGKVESSQFETPAGFTKYDNMMNMMQGEMMKRRGG